MKANELMIGDLVRFPIGNEKVVDLPYIEGKGMCASFAASATLFPVEVEKLEPMVPEYAGLIGVSEYGHLVWHKATPKLHAGKISDEQLNLVEKFYYNWKEQVRRNAEHDEIVREFRREIDFLKTEFKAETGRDVYDY